jgi:hypothetical protein
VSRIVGRGLEKFSRLYRAQTLFLGKRRQMHEQRCKRRANEVSYVQRRRDVIQSFDQIRAIDRAFEDIAKNLVQFFDGSRRKTRRRFVQGGG